MSIALNSMLGSEIRSAESNGKCLYFWQYDLSIRALFLMVRTQLDAPLAVHRT